MKRLGALFMLAAGVMLILAPAALAQSSHTYTTTLDTLNNSGASGNATVQVSGNQATVTINSHGLTPGQPHAQHIHIGGQNACPPPSADKDGSGAISVAEGTPFYGDIQVSLTTQGDVSGDSALAVDRMPVADANGNISYSRTFTLPSGVSPADLANGVIVQHGIDFNGNGMYDASAGQSSADPSLPFEATAPADCGKLVASGAQLPDTGGPSPLLAVGALLLAGSGIFGVAFLRRRSA